LPQPWNNEVRGTQVLPLINLHEPIIRVEAGPGTGKTFGLVRRVLRIVHPDGLNVPGREVLIVAFNRVIAKQLQIDIETCLASLSSNRFPVIRTVHALCLSVIGGDVRLLLPHEREAMIYDVLCDNSALKARYHTHRGAEQALRDHEAKHEDHTSLWQAVEQWLTRHHAKLISDLPGLLLDRLKGGDLEEQKFRHVIVDEYQDLTEGEQQLFFRLRHPDGQFVALGDSRQSIYLFRGNRREGLAKLDEIAAQPVTDVFMTECQRCPPPIVKAANQLMSGYKAPAMEAGSTESANIHVVTWKHLDAEIAGMAKAIADNYRANPRSQNPSDTHLVMVSRRHFGFMLRDKLAEIAPELKIDLCFQETMLETWQVREAFLFFCLLADADMPTWRAWFSYRNSPPDRDHHAPSRNASAYLRFLDANSDQITEAALAELVAEPKGKRRGEGGTILWDRASRYIALKNAMPWDALSAAELLEAAFDPAAWITANTENAEAVRRDMQLVLDKCKDMLIEFQTADEPGEAADQLRKIARTLRYQIATREPFVQGETADIQISTLWGAKGITARHVYVIGLCDETIPGERRQEYPGTDNDFIEEQRRLFYVSITRAKKTLVLSRSLSILKHVADRLGIAPKTQTRTNFHQLQLCRFLRDIIRYLPDAEKGESWGGCVSEAD
jgi:DNA helicase-2/ATP-dependent DNA helicase PcrA